MYMKVNFSSHDTKKFGYPGPLQGEGKTGVRMTPTNLHYCSNKVHLLRLQYLTITDDLPYEGSTLLKATMTIKSYPFKGFQLPY